MLGPVLAWVFASATASAGHERVGVHGQHHGQHSQTGAAPQTTTQVRPARGPRACYSPPADAVQPFAAGAVQLAGTLLATSARVMLATTVPCNCTAANAPVVL